MWQPGEGGLNEESTISTLRLDREKTLRTASALLTGRDVSITDQTCPRSAGGRHDYYSEGDYWWPDPHRADGLPYHKRDGASNPAVFSAHRRALREANRRIAAFAAAWQMTGDDSFARAAESQLRVFFLSSDTAMNPHLSYAQAIPGICTGRGIGIIDTLHLIDTARSAMLLAENGRISAAAVSGLKQWFADYLGWLFTHPYGRAELSEPNNHSVCFLVQAAVISDFVGDGRRFATCREHFLSAILPRQMAPDGSFPLELARTKPYCYSLFQVDNLSILCHVLSRGENLWEYALPDGRSPRRALEFIHPFIEDKSLWPYQADVSHFSDWLLRSPGLLFAGMGLREEKYLDLWSRLPSAPPSDEAARNLAITQYSLWFPSEY